MLFTYHSLDDQEKRVEEATARIRSDLRLHVAAEPLRWTGWLARMTRARTLAASNSVEGINVSQDDAIAAIDGEDPANTNRDTWQAVVGYRAAMNYIQQRRQSRSFRITEDVLLAVHFMICQSDLAAHPGLYRPGWVGVRDAQTGNLVHEGVDRDQLESCIQELLDYVNEGDVDSLFLRAAMTHLNLVMLHPFTDGNGENGKMHPYRRIGNGRNRRSGILFHRRVRWLQPTGVLQRTFRSWRWRVESNAQRQAVGALLLEWPLQAITDDPS